MSDRITSSNRYLRDGFIPVPCFIASRKDLNECQKLVMGSIIYHCWQKDHSWPGQETIAKEIGVCRDSVIQAVKKLEKAGLLHVTHQPGKSCLYEPIDPPETTPRGVGKSDTYLSESPTPTCRKVRHESEEGNRRSRSRGAKRTRTADSRKGRGMPDVGLFDGEEAGTGTNSSPKSTRSHARVVSSDDRTKVQLAFIEKFGLDGFNRFRSAWRLVQPVTSEQSNVFHDALSCLVKNEKVTPERFDAGVGQFTERAKTGGFEARGRRPSRDALMGFIDHARTKDEEVTWEPYGMDGPTAIFCVGVKEGGPKTDSGLLYECAWCRGRVLPKQKVCRCGAPIGWDQTMDLDKWRAIQRGGAVSQ